MMKMTNEQEAHLSRVQREMILSAEIKYRRGQKEHGGNLFEKPDKFLLDAAIEEATDLAIYLITLRDKLYPVNSD